ncbi:arylsulfatase [uncultured Draconibacterium sp.]|uniref:sulfatase family protein n=1 Tax=uncultured Draconibacterium sp. TaxID=1573823 RepID=UPI003216BD25
MSRSFISLIFLVLISVTSSCSGNKEKQVASKNKPNIVIIYLDDLGYGDVGAYGATEIQTPNIDRLANEGVMFTDGHASSATCTPSRYALLTGVYPWRNKDAKILPGTAPLIIDTAQLTIPKLLKEQGYHTGVVGKWHLGLGNGRVNWNEQVSPGPNEVGFDYSYIMAATQDRVPTVYLENGLVEGLDPNDPIEVNYEKNFDGQATGKDNPGLLTMKWHHGHNNSIINGIPRIGFMKGGEKAKWNDVDMADNFLAKAQNYVQKHKSEPFFLYYAMQQPHVPRTPNPRFVGKTNLGPRGDVIVEADWCIGEFMKTLENEGILENTLIILSSDNGPVLNDGYFDDAVERIGQHDQNGGLRGGKYSLFEAGTRVPFITYWKGKIEPKKSDALVSQIDILSSLAKLVGVEEESTDGNNLLDVLLGNSDRGRENLVLEASTRTAFRKKNWLMIPPYQGPAVITEVNIEIGNSPEYQLFDLDNDVGQQKNLAKSNPDKLNEMIKEYKGFVGDQDQQIEALELK